MTAMPARVFVPDVFTLASISGKVPASAKLTIRDESGSLVPLFQDSSLSALTPASNPMSANGSGVLPYNALYMDWQSPYGLLKVTITNSAETTVYATYDMVAPSPVIATSVSGANAFVNAGDTAFTTPYGAITTSFTPGTAGTDCAPAINAAIAYVYNNYGGGTVVIPAGTKAPVKSRITPRSNVKVVAKDAVLYVKTDPATTTGQKTDAAVGIAIGDYITDFEWEGGQFIYDGRYGRLEKLFALGAMARTRIRCSALGFYTGILNYMKPAYKGLPGALPQNAIDNHFEIDSDYCRVAQWAEGLEASYTELPCNNSTTSFTTTFDCNWPSSLTVLRLNGETGWYEPLSYLTDYTFAVGGTSGGRKNPGVATIVTTVPYPAGDMIKLYPAKASAAVCPLTNIHYADHASYANVGFYGVRWHDAIYFEGGRYLSSQHQDYKAPSMITVGCTAGGTTLTGTGFNTSLKPAGLNVALRVKINGKEYKIKSVDSNTQATISADFPFETTYASTSADVRYVRILDANSVPSGGYPKPTSVWLNAVCNRDAHVSIANFHSPVLSPSYTVAANANARTVRFGPGAMNNVGHICVDLNYTAPGYWREVTDGEVLELTGNMSFTLGDSVMTTTGGSPKFTEEIQTIGGNLDAVRVNFPVNGQITYSALWLNSNSSAQLGTYAPKVGTVSAVSTSGGVSTVTGSGTAFSNDFHVNDIVSFAKTPGVYFKVATVRSDTDMDLTVLEWGDPVGGVGSGLVNWKCSFPETYDTNAKASRVQSGDAVSYLIDVTEDGDVAYSRCSDNYYKSGNFQSFKATIPAGKSEITVYYPFMLHRTPQPHEIMVESTTVTNNRRAYVPDGTVGSTGFRIRYDGEPMPYPVNCSVWIRLMDVETSWMPDATVTSSSTVVRLPTYDGAKLVTTQGTGTTLGSDDVNKIILCNSNSALTLTIPGSATVPGYSVIKVRKNGGTGSVTLAGASGVTLNPGASGSLVTSTVGKTFTLVLTGTNVWSVEES